MIWDVEAVEAERPRGVELIVTVDFNVYLDNTGSQGRDEDITLTLAPEGLEDVAGRFLP